MATVFFGNQGSPLISWSQASSVGVYDVEVDGVLRIIGRVKSQKAPGLDGVRALCLKNCASTLAPHLAV